MNDGHKYVLQRHLPPLQRHLHSSSVCQGISFSVRSRNHVPEMTRMNILYKKRRCYCYYYCSVPNSSSGLIFVKIRAESGQIFSKNPGKTKIL